MKLKCLCILFLDITRIRKGTYDTHDRIITVRPTLLEKAYVSVPQSVEGYALGKNRLLFLVDLKNLVAVSRGSVVITAKEVQDMMDKLEALAHNKYWKFLSGKAMDIVEMLIMMGAGYGFLRLAEFFIVNAFGK